MTGLVLKLKPHEKLLINGAVLQNGDKAARLRVRTSGAAVLRLRDALHPKDAVTPLQKAYYVLQLAVAGAAEILAARDEALENLTIARADAEDAAAIETIDAARGRVTAGDLFAAMRVLRRLALPNRASAARVEERGGEQCFSPQSP